MKSAFIILLIAAVTQGGVLEFKNGAYEGLVVSVDDSIPVEGCKTVLEELENTLKGTSQFLFNALDGRCYFKSVTVILPKHWPETCTPKQQPIFISDGEKSDITLTTSHPTHGDTPWTLQTAGCGQPGEQIYLSYNRLKRESLEREIIREWAKYRYGVFDERGYIADPIYPMCYITSDKPHMTGCSDLPIQDSGLCDEGSPGAFNITEIVDSKARSSIMFAAESPAVSMFCDGGTHDKYAPTKHNQMCQRRDTLSVILQHPDFNGQNTIDDKAHTEITNTTPAITYKKQALTRYVLVIEDTKDMIHRESWSFLRNAIRKWAVYDLPSNTEVGLVLANETSASKLLEISRLSSTQSRDLVASNIPYSPGDFHAPACIECAIKVAMNMLQKATKMNGPASSVILVIAPGVDNPSEILTLAPAINNASIKIATVNYPGIIRQQPLDSLAKETNGVAFTVFEHKYNMQTSLLSTYFQLSNVMYSIATEYYQGSPSDMPIEIHQRELTDDGRSSVTGSFMLNSAMGEPARFTVYTHNTENPLIRGLKLISPSGITYSSRSDSLLSIKQLTLPANINETGSWTYTIERERGNPQPHYVQVMATPRSISTPVIRAKAWAKHSFVGGPVVLYAKVSRGDRPVLSARVEVIAKRVEFNGTVSYRERFELLDTGSGDPDITKGDGIYSRYYSAANGGAGMYMFEVTVSDNGITAYSLKDIPNSDIVDTPCCGSIVPTPSKKPLCSFQRFLPTITLSFSNEDIVNHMNAGAGRIGDLRAELYPEQQKASLTWTSPDMGGNSVARYEIKYAFSVSDIVDNFETIAVSWNNGAPFALALGSETTFSLNMTLEPSLLGQPLYFAIRAFSRLAPDTKPGKPSNWVRVLIPRPVPPTTVPPVTDNQDSNSWPFNTNKDENEVNAVIPRIAQHIDFGLELILPIVGGIALLAALLAVYCYFCVLKRRNGSNQKKPVNHSTIKSNKLNSTVTVVSQSPNHISGPNLTSTPQNFSQHGVADHHTIGLPINYEVAEDEPKQRYSLVHQQEQQLIEELKQQQRDRDHMVTPNTQHGGLSIISNNTLSRNGRTLSPYESWTASQLLHEHERRHSPLDEMLTQNTDHMSLSHQDQVSLMNEQMNMTGTLPHDVNNAQIQIRPEHIINQQIQMAPPVPPLPAFSANTGYPVNYHIYGVHGAPNTHPVGHPPPLYSAIKRNGTLMPFNPSLQGSLNSVNSTEKKRRNVTMV